MHHPKISLYYLPLLIILLLTACSQKHKKPQLQQLVSDPASIDAVVQKNIQEQLQFANDNAGKLNDSMHLDFLKVLDKYYESNDHTALWSSMEKWKPVTASLINYLDHAVEDGLFKDDYHFNMISALKQTLDADSLKRMDAVLWTKADLLLTDACMHILKDLKQGRLQPDSLDWRNSPEKFQSFFAANMDKLVKGESLDSVFKHAQPIIKRYWLLKSGIKSFIDSMDTKLYTYVSYPYKATDKNDSIAFVKKLLKRLSESSFVEKDATVDSQQLASLVKKFQQHKKLNADGKINASFIKQLNITDIEKYKRIAITLDRYKQLPDSMPEKYILVNLPGFYLQVWDADTVSFTSKVICGKPATSTPLITSAISDIVLFPTWTVPTSIIKKEMLPALKNNPGYLARKGLRLYNNHGDAIDPYSVNWSKYSKGIPYKIQQGSGDDNALGIIKFNFSNPFDVYLHDTNQRYLFKNSMRALSHGCVRVQDWEKLAFYIARNDSMQVHAKDTLSYNTDSITNWIATKERRRIVVKHKMPLFIRYFGCEGINGTIKFYDDIYDEDKKAKEKFFALK
ncbi:L,D-transpeptidase family protein [soil metagenome]